MSSLILNSNETVSPLERTMRPELVGERYGFISTHEILESLMTKGWNVSRTSFGKRKVGELGTQKHLVVLENEQVAPIVNLATNHIVRPNITILNSHDKSSAFHMFIGMTRIACLNGLIAGTSINSFRVVHSNNMIKDISNILEQTIESIPMSLDVVQRMVNTQLTTNQVVEFQKNIIDFRLKDVEGLISKPNRLSVRRQADLGSDLFTQYNIAQEALLRGGIQFSYMKTIDGVESTVNQSTRKVNSVSQNIKLNRYAWDQATQLIG